MKKPESGFSLLELSIVVAVLLIVAAMAVPAMQRVKDGYQLNSSGHAIADMLTQARMAAVKANLPYYAQVNSSNPMLASASSAAGAATGDPSASTEGNVALLAASGSPPDHTQLDTYLGSGTPPIQVGGPIGFSARGIPCLATTSQYICQGPAAFEWFMQSSAGGWEAITVTPAGRVRSWRQSSATSSMWN